MADAPSVKRVLEEMVVSYEERLQSISSMLDSARAIFGEFQESVTDTRQEREKLKIELREALARNKSLRRKDFDAMMNGILLSRDERGREVRSLLSAYLVEQEQMAATLKDNLRNFRDALHKNRRSPVEGIPWNASRDSCETGDTQGRGYGRTKSISERARGAVPYSQGASV